MGVMGPVPCGQPDSQVERSLRRLSWYTVVGEYAWETWEYWGLRKAHARIYTGTVELFAFLSLVNRCAMNRYYQTNARWADTMDGL